MLDTPSEDGQKVTDAAVATAKEGAKIVENASAESIVQTAALQEKLQREAMTKFIQSCTTARQNVGDFCFSGGDTEETRFVLFNEPVDFESSPMNHYADAQVTGDSSEVNKTQFRFKTGLVVATSHGFKLLVNGSAPNSMDEGNLTVSRSCLQAIRKQNGDETAYFTTNNSLHAGLNYNLTDLDDGKSQRSVLEAINKSIAAAQKPYLERITKATNTGITATAAQTAVTSVSVVGK